jgi:protein SDA1
MNDLKDKGSDQAEDSEEEDKSKGSGSKGEEEVKWLYWATKNAVDASLWVLKRLQEQKKRRKFCQVKLIKLSNENFKRIRELNVWAKPCMSVH